MQDVLTLKERLVLRVLFFIVDWLGQDIKDLHTFKVSQIMEEFSITERRNR
jgi:hypothetical protein